MKKRLKRMFLTLLVLVLIATGVSGYIFYKNVLGGIGKIDNDDLVTVAPQMEDFETDPADENMDPTAVTARPESIALESVQPINDGHLINILLVGQDRQGGQGRQRSDTMILCSYNLDTNEVSLISFLRDLYVKIPGGYSDNRLNSPYVFGGFPLLYSTFKENFGVSIDGGVEVDFQGFIDIVDLLGGVDIHLTAAEAKFVSSNCKEGINHLNGRKALNYARIRKIDSDFGRTNRQRTLILALFEKVKTSDADTLMKLMNRALSMVTTDMTNSSITSLAASILPNIGSVKINTYAVPQSGAYRNANVRGMAVLIPDLVSIRNKLESEYLPL